MSPPSLPDRDPAGPPGAGDGGSGGAGSAAACAPRRRGRRLAWALAGVAGAAVLVAAGLVLALRTPAGTRAVLGAVPGLQVDGLEGALIGDFTASRLLWQSGGIRIEARELAWTALRPERVASVRWGWGLAVDRLSIGRLVVQTQPSPASPRTGVPASLALPLALRVSELRIAELQASVLGERPLRELRASIRLGHARDGQAEHRIELRSVHWDRLSGSGWLAVGLQAPMPLQGALDARADEVLAQAAGADRADHGARPAAEPLQPQGTGTKEHRAKPRQTDKAQAKDARAQQGRTADARAKEAAAAEAPSMHVAASGVATQRAREAVRDAPQAAAKAAAQAVAATAAQGAREAGSPGEARAVRAQARIGGTLARWTVQAAAQARDQALSLKAQVTPFDVWPVDRLELQARGFDLAALDSRAPRTRLSGDVSLLPVAPQMSVPPAAGAQAGPAAAPDGRVPAGAASPEALTRPQDAQTAVRARLRNDLAGRWDQGRLPLRELDLRLRLAGLSVRQGWVDALSASLGSAEHPGGQLTGRGRWALECLADCGSPAAGAPPLSGGPPAGRAGSAADARAAARLPATSAGRAESTAPASPPARGGTDRVAAAERTGAGTGKAAPAGPGSGLAGSAAWSVQLDLRDLRPGALDSRAPQMRLSGPVQLEQAAAGAGLKLSLDLKGALEAVSPPAPLDMRGQLAYTPGETLVAALSSRLGAARVALNAVAQSVDAPSAALLDPLTRPPAQPAAPGEPGPGAVSPRSAAPARVPLPGDPAAGRSAAPAAGADTAPDWRIEADASLERVDPLVWWPGGQAPSSAPSDLNGQARVQLRWRGATAAQQADAASLWQTLLQRLGGQGQVRIERSQLLGVPLELQLQLKDGRDGAAPRAGHGHDGGAPRPGNGRAGTAPWQLDARLLAGGNAVSVTGQVDRSPREADRWSVLLDAPGLERLSPWAALGGVRRLAGTVRGEVHVDGRAQRLSSSGQIQAQGLALGLPAGAGAASSGSRVPTVASTGSGTAAVAAARTPPATAAPAASVPSGQGSDRATRAPATLRAPAPRQAALPSVMVAGRPQPADARTVAAARRPAPSSSLPMVLHEADRLTVQWTIGPLLADAQAPLSVRMDGDGLRSAGWRVDGLRAQTEGSAAEHRFNAQAALRPPRAVGGADDGLPPTRLLASVQGQGHWAASPRRADGWRWDARIGKLELARDPASLPVLSARLRAAAEAAAARAAATDALPATRNTANAMGVTAASRPAPARIALPDFSRPWLRAERFELSLFRAEGRLGAELSAVRIESLGAVLDVQQASWQDHGDAGPALELAARLEPLAVAPVLAILQPQAGWGGDLTVAGSLRWQRRPGLTAAAGRTMLQAELLRSGGDLSLIETDLEGGLRQRLSLTEARVTVDARDGVWRLSQRLAARGSATISGEQTLRTTASALLPDAQAQLAGRLDAQVADLRRWSSWMPAGWQFGGQLAARLALAGTAGEPVVTGRVEGRSLEARNLLQGIDLRDGMLDVTLQGDQATLERLTARAGRGRLDATGQAELGSAPHARLKLQLTDFALLQRVDRRAVVAGEADLDLREQAVAVRGAFRVVEGLVDISRSDAPALGDDVMVVRRPPGTDPAAVEAAAQAAPGTAPGPSGMLPRLNANVSVDLGSNLRLRGRGIDTRLSGSLLLTADPQVAAGQPRLRGTINTVRGTYAAYGQKLAIDRGAITFTGPIDNPQLDILATRARSAFSTASTGAATVTDTDVVVGVLITGTAQNPRVRLHSVPDMADSEKLSWLLFGRGTGGLASQETALLQTAAMALLSGEGESTTGQIISAIGLDEFSLRQGASSTGNNVQDTVVTLGKQISRRLYLGYERGLSDTLGTWQIIYRLARRLTLRAQSGADNSLDLIWTLSWN